MEYGTTSVVAGDIVDVVLGCYGIYWMLVADIAWDLSEKCLCWKRNSIGFY